MNKDQEQLERIVAYLDGELSAEESARVEQQLASDEQFRQTLQGAERAWTALDQLPMAHVSDEFAKTTMEMVVDAAREDVEAKTIALPIQQRKKKTTTAVMTAMAVLLGALTFRVLANSPNRRLIADLPVIQHVDIYSQIKDVAYLRELQRGLGEQLAASTVPAEQLSESIEKFRLVSDSSNRDTWLESLPVEEQVTLRAKFNRFRDLPPPQVAELRELHRQIDAAEDREQLLISLFQYQQWLKELPPSKQYEYRSLEGEERLRRVAAEMQRTAREATFELSDQELRELVTKVWPMIEKLREENMAAFRDFYVRRSPREQRDFESLPRAEKMKRVFRFALMRSPQRMKDIVDTVADELPEEASVAFERLRPHEKAERIQAWIQQYQASMREGGRSSRVSAEELEDFFLGLLPEAKEELLALSAEDMQWRLQRMYRGRMYSRGRRGPLPAMDRRGPRDGPPTDGLRRERFDPRGGPRPPDDRRRFGEDGEGRPRRGPRFGEDFDGPPPRGPGRDERRRPPRPNGPPPEQD